MATASDLRNPPPYRVAIAAASRAPPGFPSAHASNSARISPDESALPFGRVKPFTPGRSTARW